MTSPCLRAAAVLSVLLLAAGCGGGDEDSGGGSGGDFAKQSGDEIAAAAKADMKSLDSVKYSGEIKSSGSSISLDIQASADGECTGTIGIGDGTAEVLATGGENWYRPDEAFWRQQAPDDADAIIAAVGDKWVIDSDASFSQFCDLEAFFDNIFKDEADGGAYKTTGTDEVDGQRLPGRCIERVDDALDDLQADDQRYRDRVRQCQRRQRDALQQGSDLRDLHHSQAVMPIDEHAGDRRQHERRK